METKMAFDMNYTHELSAFADYVHLIRYDINVI